MTKFHHMASDMPDAQTVKEDHTSWLLLVSLIALDIVLFASVHLNDTLWRLGHVLSRVTLMQ